MTRRDLDELTAHREALAPIAQLWETLVDRYTPSILVREIGSMLGGRKRPGAGQKRDFSVAKLNMIWSAIDHRAASYSPRSVTKAIRDFFPNEQTKYRQIYYRGKKQFGGKPLPLSQIPENLGGSFRGYQLEWMRKEKYPTKAESEEMLNLVDPDKLLRRAKKSL